MGGLDDAGASLPFGSLAWVWFAVVAGFALAAAARALLARRVDSDDETDWERGWNALAPLVDR